MSKLPPTRNNGGGADENDFDLSSSEDNEEENDVAVLGVVAASAMSASRLSRPSKSCPKGAPAFGAKKARASHVPNVPRAPLVPLVPLLLPPVARDPRPVPRVPPVPRAPRVRGDNFSKEEMTCFLEIMREVIPIGMNEWDTVARLHAESSPGKNRTTMSLKNKFSKLVQTRGATGNPYCPPEIMEAHAIQNMIRRKAELTTMDTPPDEDDDDGEDDDADDRADNPPILPGAPAVAAPEYAAAQLAMAGRGSSNAAVSSALRKNMVVFNKGG